MSIATEFKKWLESREEKLLIEVNYRKNEGSPDHSTVVAEFESKNSMGRITVWECGFCDIEVLDINSGEDTFNEHFDSISEADFPDVLDSIKTHLK